MIHCVAMMPGVDAFSIKQLVGLNFGQFLDQKKRP
jgi:hypothetical protein